LNLEVTRLLAMIQAKGPELPARLVSAIGPTTDPAMDFHLLAATARLGPALPTNTVERVAQALVALDRKLNSRANRPKQNWTARLNELTSRLLERNPRLAVALVQQPELVRPGNLPLVALLGETHRAACARLYLDAVQRTTAYPWTVELVDLLAALPPTEVHPLFRRQWGNLALRDRLVLELASKPIAEDRVPLVSALSSSDPRVVQAAAGALLKLPRDPGSASASVVAALKALRRFTNRPEDRETRLPLVWLVGHLMGEKLEVREGQGNLTETYQPVFNRVAQRLPGALAQVDADDSESQAKWDQVLKAAPWNRGSAEQGQVLFENRGCANCHVNAGAFGPDLAGVAQRLAPRDLFYAILYPSREIAPAWRMETFRLRGGENVTGRVTYESGEIIMVQTGLGTNARIEVGQIVSREKSDTSFMPGGLLTGLGPQDLADLHAWLKSR
jgi:putative heme-binding domain-containing protein